jgi:ribose transport system substrate-binding protein
MALRWLPTMMMVLYCACARQPGATSHPPNSAATQAAEKRKYTIAVIPKGTLHDFWKSIHAGAIKAERELGNVEIIWKGPTREDDREQQIQVVENFVNRGVDAIVLAPLDRRALVQPAERARRRKIPVVIIDSGLDSENIVSFVATDNYHGGVIAARHMGKLLEGKGNLVVLRYQVGSASTEQREQGFLDTIKKELPNLVILSDNQYAGALREDAVSKSENLLTRFGERIDGWFCPCEPVVFGALQALRSRSLVPKIRVIGFDATPELVDGLRRGELAGLVLQDPVQMGYLGVRTAVAAIEGKSVDKVVSTGEYLVTKDNMDDPKLHDLHSPDLAAWLGGE